ncbi:hypothetical protein K431DRAFT_214434 [Polychaeton citri CBS 116435]|uniref:UBX domain-containing protein n=1 Tax=Polychaeton citri CBS 116435 TaxID=1314669 RepID=A0A9P4QGJ5_9PEZI|nr:hypothetical protein K431DRAFT_214434 [Polychaeton citri CBS 116435]
MASPTALDVGSLNEEQQMALQQFTAVTDQQLETAIPLLQKCQWNAQIAITRFFDGDTDTIDPVAEAAQLPPPESRRSETLMDSIPHRSAGIRRSVLEAAPRVVPTPESQRVQYMPFPFNVILFPINLAYMIFQRAFQTVGYIFPFLPRLLNRFYSGRTLGPSRDTGRRPLNPRDAAERFVREFEEEYGVAHETLPFHEGGYAQAFDIAKRDLKFLLVVLLSPEHDDTAPFVRDTLLSPELVDFVKNPSNNIILWGGTIHDAEAYQVANALNATRFPYTTLIVHTPSVSSTAMSKVATSAGLIAPQDLVTKMQTAMTTQSQELEGSRRRRREQEATQYLRREQESAYERSLAQDREKARKRKEEEAEKARAEKEKQELEQKKADEAKNLAQWRQWRAQSIAAEPGAEVKDVVRISLRLPSGERVIRKFQSDSVLEELYAYVECYDLVKDGQYLPEKQTAKPSNFSHEYSFQLVSPMPREVYDIASGGSIRSRIGRSGNLIVEKTGQDEIEDDDDDEE